MRRLLQEYKVQKSIDPIRVPVTTEGFPAIGPAKARVTIVEFADFQCPFCAVLFHTLKDVKEQYSDNVRIVFRQFPLTNTHERAQKAAEASLCAFEQKKFWEMHDSMFLDNNNLEVPALKRKASTLMLNMNEFNSCIDSGRYASAVAADIQEGVKLGVTGTPTVFINGMSFLGAQSASDISRIIDDELMRDQKP
jgi:protein-disulfide isomerase